MLRITTDEKTQCRTLRLEGRLEGPWVAVLARCFRSAVGRRRGRQVRIDLNGVTFVDSAGKAQLAEVFAQGAELLGEDIEIKAIVEEICAGRARRARDDHGEVSHVSNQNEVNPSEQLSELQRLRAELSAVDEELVKAARPLERLDDLNEEQRQRVASELRAGLIRWDSVTRRIAQVLGLDGANGKKAKAHEGGSR
jgi:ABC-type transporter Mla MlaB component